MTAPPNPLHASEWSVEPMPFSMGADLIADLHYSKGSANTAVYRHGLFRADDPMTPYGAAFWMLPTRPAALSVSDDPDTVLTLSRLVVHPDVPTNGASFLVGRSVQRIRRDGRYTVLLTYADEGQGHTGAIYRATNWQYVGVNAGDPVWRDGRGRIVTKRRPDRGSYTAAQMRARGCTSVATRKHKFVLRLPTNVRPGGKSLSGSAPPSQLPGLTSDCPLEGL